MNIYIYEDKKIELNFLSLYLILDICHTWYHARCVKLGRVGVQSVDKYHCPRCESMCGPSVMKPKTNDHRCVLNFTAHLEKKNCANQKSGISLSYKGWKWLTYELFEFELYVVLAVLRKWKLFLSVFLEFSVLSFSILYVLFLKILLKLFKNTFELKIMVLKFCKPCRARSNGIFQFFFNRFGLKVGLIISTIRSFKCYL